MANRITLYHFCFFAALLPFDRIFSELVLISLLLHTLFHLHIAQLRLVDFKQVLVPVIPFLLTVAGTVYSPLKEQAFFEWQIQLAILLFPLICAVTTLDIQKYTDTILLVMGISCIVTILYLFEEAFRVIAFHHLPYADIFTPAFINHNFSLPIDIHATYFSLYIGLSIIVFLKRVSEVRNRQQRMLYAIGLLILSAGLIQLASRSVLIAMVIIVVLIVPLFVVKKKRRLIFITTSLAFVLGILFFVTQNNAFKTRYLSGLKSDLMQTTTSNRILEPRALRWECAVELIKKAPVLGYGSGSEILLLKEKYFTHQYYSSYINELNAHNEYLSIWIKTGIVGLIAFLFMLYKGFQRAFRTNNLLFAGFLVLITVTCFSENILDVNKGIFFFSFFLSIFYSNRVGWAD